jgi:TATA-box binding protein (TBP) (component of TFIID and TFIIIB)
MDQEWMQFITKQSETEWNKTESPTASTDKPLSKDLSTDKMECPECDELFISTKTKVLFLNQGLDIHRIFWDIPITEHWRPHSGVIKKQMKIVSKTPEEYEEYRSKLVGIPYYTESVIKQINNPSARRLKFKDERKITVGLSKKDIMNCRGKVKNAFYNCFAMIMRFIHDGVFREIHVKIFNTGKMEIPGVLNAEILTTVKRMILETLRAHTLENELEIDFVENESEDSVLINSNFNCGFYINRDRLHSILRGPKYNIEAAYDPCSYPGVKCKFYFNHDIGFDTTKQNGTIMQSDRVQKMSELGYNKKYTEVSFMIFRTGSCLIVGNCSEPILRFIFEFIKQVLKNEFSEISAAMEDPVVKVKNNKIRKKTIMMSQEYYVRSIQSV